MSSFNRSFLFSFLYWWATEPTPSDAFSRELDIVSKLDLLLLHEKKKEFQASTVYLLVTFAVDEYLSSVILLFFQFFFFFLLVFEVCLIAFEARQ